MQTDSFLSSFSKFFFFNSNISSSHSQKFFLPLFSHFQKYFLRFKRCTKILSFSYSHYFHYFIFNLKKKIFFSFSNNFFNPKTKYTQITFSSHSQKYFLRSKRRFLSLPILTNISIQKRSFTRKLIIVEPDSLDRFLCFD